MVMAWSISYRYMIDPDDTRAALAPFADQPIIGLDTETYWDYGARRNRLSLLQLAAPTGEVIVIDALTASVEEARALIENPSAMMAAHNARFDEGVLRGAGFEVAGLVDTLRLAGRNLRVGHFRPGLGFGAPFWNADGQDVSAERLEAQAAQPRPTRLRRARRQDRAPGLSGVVGEIGRSGTVGRGVDPREDRPSGRRRRWFQPRRREIEAQPG